jgi:hypothetical protein
MRGSSISVEFFFKGQSTDSKTLDKWVFGSEIIDEETFESFERLETLPLLRTIADSSWSLISTSIGGNSVNPIGKYKDGTMKITLNRGKNTEKTRVLVSANQLALQIQISILTMHANVNA